MSRRQQPQGVQVSLFPFLTVLLCAMGALIFLFLVITQQIRESSLAARHQAVAEIEPAIEPEVLPEPEATLPQPAELKPTEPPPIEEELIVEEVEQTPEPEPPVLAEKEPAKIEPVEPVDLNIPWRSRLQELRAMWNERVEQQKKLNSQTEQLQHRLATWQSAASDFKANQQQIESALQEEQSRAQELKSQQEELRSHGIDLEKQIKRKQAEVRTAQSEFAIIPYDGQLGTIRRPILIECQEDSITFYPEGVSLTADDVRGFTPLHNPLAAGAEALIDHWKSVDEKSGKEVTEPYLLMIVRPSGSVSFYAAQKLLSGLEVQTGYELLPEEFPVKWPEADPVATARCREAVDAVLNNQPTKQEMRLAELQAGNKHLTAEQFRRQRFDAGAARLADELAEEEHPGRRRMRFDVNTGRFVEVTPAPRRTDSSWENLNVGPSAERRRAPRREQSGPGEGSGNDVAQRDDSNEAPSLLNLDDSAESVTPAFTDQQSSEQQLSDQQQNGGGVPQFVDSSDSPPKGEFGKSMKSIREIDPRDGLPSQRRGSTDFSEPRTDAFAQRRTEGGGAPYNPHQESSGRSAMESPWYQSQAANSGGGDSQSAPDSPGGLRPPSSPGQAGEHTGTFTPPSRMKMQQKVRVTVDGDSIQIEGAKPIKVDIQRDDAELAAEFKRQIASRVATWSDLPTGFYWSPYLQFTVLPGGNVNLERLLLQLPTREIDYETDLELERLKQMPLDKPLVRESIDEILLLDGQE